MKSKSDRLNPSSDVDAYNFSIDSCNHLISTSLRDLNEKYKDLRCDQKDSINLIKKNPPDTVEDTKSDSE